MNKILLVAVAGFALFFSSTANSAFITANGAAINPLDLSSNYNSFQEFFDYQTSDSSSHTGFERANRVVIFLAQINNEFGLIITSSGPGGYSGHLVANIAGTEGEITFIDDPTSSGFGDQLVGSTVTWIHSPNKSDGLIFSNIYSSDWSIDLSLKKISGGLGGIDVLTFDANKQASTAYSTGISRDYFKHIKVMSSATSGSTPANSVSGPSLLGLIGIAFSFLLLRTKQ